MGSRGDSGASGSDAGFENTTKSKLTKKNQKLVDTSFDQRGKVKMEDSILPPSLSILKGPFKKGTEVNRKFFTDKVLGSKNYKGTTKEEFEKMSVSQQESIYGDYMKGRQEGRTDAYGNPTNQGGGNDNNNQPAEPVIVKKNIGGTEVQTTQAKLDEEKEDSQYDVRKVKKKGRTENILTSSKGVTKVSSDYSLGKKSLLGMV